MKNEFYHGMLIGSLLCFILVGTPSAFFFGRLDAIHWQIVANELKVSSEELIKQVEGFKLAQMSCLEEIPVKKKVIAKK